LYGTAVGAAYFGSGPGDGVVFKMKTNGAGFTVLYSFTGGSDGAYPAGNLTLSYDTLYGTAIGVSQLGVSVGYGTVFQLNTNGTGFTTLYNLTNGTDGSAPLGGVILSGNTLYGTTSEGGASDSGTLYSLALPPVVPPRLSIVSAGGNVIVSWPTNSAEFTLESSPTILPAVWSTVNPPPTLIGGMFTVTNPIAGSQQYYRLSQ
jgi:uncharacterized repeat protein (TIGR03803 family)